ncbi:hypothetical protein V6N13_055765 [Hibiscus sabdariffa]|uniref:Phosphoinositide phospholipase C n=1 Tax=Hibiscus sabdariffa TaxID=183260 RepID=A0ABR2BMQ9_9ROSI
MSDQSYTVCLCFRRRFKMPVAQAPEEIKKLFEQYSENELMNADEFHKFLVEVQKEDEATIEDAQKIIDGCKNVNENGLHIEPMFRYLFGDDNFPQASNGVHHDMSAPLSRYFIFTGHNSYLTGNQLNSDCSDVPIINALKRGVRVIELDIWPNSDKDDVDVLHGGTLTAPVTFIKCLESIKEYAFVSSEFPVVITLEDHLTPDLQTKAAKMIIETFGDILFTPGHEALKEFPSPESLKKRIIISTKPPKEHTEAKEVKDEGNDLQNDEAGEEVAQQNTEPSGTEPEQRKAPEYKRLIAIHAGKPKGGLDECLKLDSETVRRLSLSELELENAAQTHGGQIIRFTQRNMLRIYPKGIRVDSSNYNPMIAWTHGAQMVAFNMQGNDKHLWLMHGMFKANGRCGYVKKPDFLLDPDKIFDPQDMQPVRTTLKVTVYMGEGWYQDFDRTHFDPYSPPDFYANVGIAGVPEDKNMNKTDSVSDSWVPCWNQEFEFNITVPELALLLIEVHEHDVSEQDDFAGQTCIPITELKCGIRAVPLMDVKGDKYNNVKLLMRFEFINPP